METEKAVLSENYLKYENYKEQFKRLNRALANGFNLEAVFIEYAIMEDRTESVLCHAKMWEAYVKSRRGREPSIDSKIRYIQKLAENKGDLLHRYFSDELLKNILEWKEKRNSLIHALLKQRLEHDEIRQLANIGSEYAKVLRNRAGSYIRVSERIN